MERAPDFCSECGNHIADPCGGATNSCSLSLVDAPQSIDQLIRAAITDRRLIRFWYNGQERIAEPHDYGIQNGKPRLLAYQVGGQSNSRPLPAWRLVNVSGMTQLEVLQRTFAGNRPAPSGRRHKWDILFIRVGEPAKTPLGN